MRGERGIDEVVFAKVRLDASDWETFLAGTPLAGAHFEDAKRYLLSRDEGWWDPERPDDLPTAQAQLRGGKVLNLGVDRSAPGKVVLYIVYHGT